MIEDRFLMTKAQDRVVIILRNPDFNKIIKRSEVSGIYHLSYKNIHIEVNDRTGKVNVYLTGELYSVELPTNEKFTGIIDNFITRYNNYVRNIITREEEQNLYNWLSNNEIEEEEYLNLKEKEK